MRTIEKKDSTILSLQDELKEEKNRPPEIEYVNKNVPYEKCDNCKKDDLDKQIADDKEKTDKAINEFKARKIAISGYLFGALLYGILATVLTALRSKVFLSDLSGFFIGVWNFIVWIFNSIKAGILWTAAIANKIPQPLAAGLIYWLIVIILSLLAFAIIFGGLGLIIWRVTGAIKEDCADSITLGFILVSMAIVVFLGEVIHGFLKVNLIGLWSILVIAFILIRAKIEKIK